MASSSTSSVNDVQRQVDEVKGVMCALARPSPAPAPAVARARARHPTPASVRRRQQNVDIMLQNLDKTEALENKSADLANQAKTCAAPPTAPTTSHPHASAAAATPPRPHLLARGTRFHKSVPWLSPLPGSTSRRGTQGG